MGLARRTCPGVMGNRLRLAETPRLLLLDLEKECQWKNGTKFVTSITEATAADGEADKLEEEKEAV